MLSDRNQTICKMRQEGHTLQEIGNLYHITRERVRQITDPRRKHRRTLTDKYKNKTLAGWIMQNNKTLPDAAETFGISQPILRKVLKGETCNGNTINKILTATGYTYEMVFGA